MIKQLFKTMVAVLAIAAAATGPARAQIYGNNIDLSNGESGTLSSDMTCTNFILYNQGTLTVNQGVTLTLNCEEFNLKTNSAIHLHGTMTGSVGDEPDWNNNSYIDVYLSDGAKYTVSGLECMDGDDYLRYYGYDAATDGHGTVSVTNGSAAVTASSIGYSSTTYTFTATPASGYHFVSWTKGAGGEELGTDASIDVTCEQNGQYQVYANFEEDVPAGPQLYNVTFAEGTEDVGNWSFTPAAATNTGVTEGTVVTVKYNGTSRINSIELKSKMLATPLTIEAITDGTVKVQSPKNGMKYKKNNEDIVVLGTSTTTITVAEGDKVAFYGNGTNITTYQGTSIYGGTANVKVYGNIMSLVDEENFATATTLTADRAFYSLFRENAKLSDASGLLLPATTLTERCYMDMFLSCVNLTTAPAELPATTLTGNCYAYMFQGCTRLTTAPVLPAPVLAPSCYYKMFTDCMNLNSVTCLATDISASSCTRNWLDNAGSNVTGTKTFNAASMVEWLMDDVSGIPEGWTLVTPAHTPLTLEALTDGTVKVQSPQSGMQYTLNGGTKTAVTSAAIDVVAGDKVAFYGNGTSITSYDGTTIAGGSADVKVYGNIMSLVDEENFATATTLSVQYQFYNLFSENNHLKDASGLLLPATTLAPTCYAYMFHYCSSLTAAPAELPATTLAEACYRGMFQDCMSLTTAPELPAQTLVSYCYAHMFQLCTKLNSVTCLATSGINQNSSTESWLDNAGTDQSVTTKTFNAASTAEWPTSVHGIPEGWTLGAQSTPEPVTLVPTGNTNEWTFTMPADNMLLMLNYATPHTVRFADGNNGWQVQDVTAATSAVAPAILQNVMTGDSLVVTAPASLPGKVKSVKAVKYVPPVLVQSIVLDKQTAFLAKDSTMTLSVASVLPENAADKSYTWSSDATGVASVNENGVVTGMDAGTANIIATANDGSGVADTCVVTVLRSAILDGVRVLYASDYDLETWSTVVGYNPGVMYQDGDYVKLTSNGAFLCHDGHPVYADDYSYPPFNDCQWLLVTNIDGADFYYHQGETWQQAIDANRLNNDNWSIEGGQVKFHDLTLVDSNYNPVDPTATIDPSTVNYYLYFLNN